MIIDIMTIPVVQFSKEGYKTKGFWLKINCSLKKSLNLQIGLAARCQNLTLKVNFVREKSFESL